MLNIDYSIWPIGVLWIQIANFLVLLFVLNAVAYRPIRRIMSERHQEMSGLKERAETLQEKLTQEEKALQENVINARKEGFGLKEQIKQQGAETEKGMLQEASSRTEERLGKARAEIEQMVAGVRRTLQGEVDMFSQEVAEKILGRSF
ncbi:MAG: ATP synthase F0 subunit B [Deltaproteobacteria bacterium]|nr:ATP synthase F0 subunit B [Deltaproteobacteria bacterium]